MIPDKVTALDDHHINDFNRESIRIYRHDDNSGRYTFMVTDEDGDPQADAIQLDFQQGNPKDGANGITDEALIAVVIDRLRQFNAGELRCRENSLAITKLEEAMLWLLARSYRRVARGVEGTQGA